MRFLVASIVLLTCCYNLQCVAQSPTIGDVVSRDAIEVYRNGLAFLVRTQNDRGTWPAGEGVGPGTTGLAVLAFLASGEDPNHGPYREVIRKGLRHIIGSQSAVTGYMGPSMYHHGFATLALCEAYGMVDDSDLFDQQSAQSNEEQPRSIAEAAELAVRASLTAQQHSRRDAWRYAPNAGDADTSVSGAVMMGLLAARNAGIKVPDEAIDKAINYFASMTAPDGSVGYTSAGEVGAESIARSSIVNLVFAVARRKDLEAYKQTTRYLVANRDRQASWPEYSRYYLAQALFQSDVKAWKQWNERLIRKLARQQKPDGSFDGELGVTNSTTMNLLALAVNFRFLPIYER